MTVMMMMFAWCVNLLLVLVGIENDSHLEVHRTGAVPRVTKTLRLAPPSCYCCGDSSEVDAKERVVDYR